MRKITILLFLLIGILSIPVFAVNEDLGKMENALANGYLEASKNNISAALGYFTESVALAEKARSWKGLVDAGNAFIVLGNPKEAMRTFKKAFDMANALKDWRGLVAVSYSYIDLPEKMDGKKYAVFALSAASDIAAKDKDWRGLIETGEAFLDFGEKDKTEKCLNDAKDIVKELESSRAAESLGKAAKEMGFMNIYDECAAMSSSFEKAQREYAATPPPYWRAEGESVAGPKEVDVETQKAMRASADNDIRAKQEYLAKMEKKEEEKSKYYGIFSRYYDYPYYHSYYVGYGYRPDLTNTEISGWASHHLSHYRRDKDVYIYMY